MDISELGTHPDQLMTIDELAALLKVTIPTLYNWQNQGIAPKKIRIGNRAVRYRVADVREWIDTREAA